MISALRAVLVLVLGGALAGVAALTLVPLALLTALGCLLASATARRARPAAPVQPARAATPPRASILILNWNGREFLARLLPSVRAAVRHAGGEHEVVVIDNGSEDDSVAFVQREFPEVRIVRHATNLMFVRGYNEAWSAATHELVVLLNNDMVVDEGFLPPLLAPFADPQVFAVSAQVFFRDPTKRREETGLTTGRLHHGLVKLAHEPVDADCAGTLPTLWAGGGSSAFDRAKLRALGGFDALYDPFYFEDAGLSFEAWRRGWKVLFAPASKVWHEHRGTSGRRFSQLWVERIRRRNGYLFAWRNFDAPATTLATTLLLPVHALRHALRRHDVALPRAVLEEAAAAWMTLVRLPRVLAARWHGPRHWVRSDRTALRIATQRWHFARATAQPPPPDRPLRLLMLLARLPRLATDGSWAQFELVRALGRTHHVTVFAFLEREDDDQALAALRPHVARLETMPLEPRPRDPDLHWQIPARLWQDYSGLLMRERVARLLRSEEYDSVQVDYLEMAHVVRDLVAGLPVVHVCHEPLTTVCRNATTPRSRLALWQASNYERALYARFRRVVCLSEEDAAVVASLAPGTHPRVIRNGLNLERIRACAHEPQAAVIAFVGYYGHGPNVDAARWLAEVVFPRVRAVHGRARLWLIGRGGDAALQALAGRDGIEVRGFVPDLGQCLAETAVVAAPLREGGGLRSKVLEAMAYGKAIVATPLGAAGTGAVAGRDLEVAADATEFASKLVALLHDPARRRQLEQAARAHAETAFSITRTAAEYEAVHRETMAEAWQ